ncbi:MAG: HAMP domain-containing protein, partial [Spirochaetaceae bacterium]|nr:HAMP domain-containing protein [Spirochaetaceae bacterium]
MKLQNRLQLAFSANIILLIIISLINTVFILNSRRTLDDLSLKIFTSEKHIDTIRFEVTRIHGDILSRILSFEKIKTDEITDEYALIFYRELENLEKIFPEDKTHFNEIRNKFQQFYLFGKWMYNLSGPEELKEHPDSIRKFSQQKNNLVTHIDIIVNKYEEYYLETFREVNNKAYLSLIISIIVVITGTVLSLFISIILSRSIARPILTLTDTLREVEKGNFEVHSNINSNDEIGLMSNAVNRMSGELGTSFKNLTFLKSLLNSILDSVDSIVIAVDEKMNVSHWNHNAVLLTGIETTNAIDKELDEIFPEEILSRGIVQTAIAESRQKEIFKKSVFYREKTHYFNVAIYPHKNPGLNGVVIVIQNVTEQILIEEVMVQSEKMLSVGGLAAGMAHEINNPLAGMIQTANVMSKRLDNKSLISANIKAAEEAGITMEGLRKYIVSRGIPRMIESINMAGQQITEIVHNMLSFSRRDDNRRSSQNIEELIDKTLKLAETDYDMKKNYDFRQIKIIKEYEKNLPPIICENSKIQQVILNILRNGAQAMQSEKSDNHQFIVRIRSIEERNRITIEIEDNGPGMDEEVRKRVFEPFFTTKPIGIGTGLGLSVSYFIITDTHKGEMFVKSQKGAGTTFIINL